VFLRDRRVLGLQISFTPCPRRIQRIGAFMLSFWLATARRFRESFFSSSNGEDLFCKPPLSPFRQVAGYPMPDYFFPAAPLPPFVPGFFLQDSEHHVLWVSTRPVGSSDLFLVQGNSSEPPGFLFFLNRFPSAAEASPSRCCKIGDMRHDCAEALLVW